MDRSAVRRRPAIDFYLYASHEVETWHPIVMALRRRDVDARFVLEPPGRNLARGSAPDPTKGWKDDKATNLTPLMSREVAEALRQALDDVGDVPLSSRRRSASAVTTQGSRWLRVYAGRRIRTMYGVGFVNDSWGHGPINDGFDLVLAHGRFSVDAIGERPGARVEAVGYPKWASFRRGEFERRSARRDLDLTDGRPMIGWLPTWAQHSSLDDYLGPVAALCEQYAVVLKPHNNSARFEMERLDRARALGITVLDPTTPITRVITAADVVLADPRSGSFTEAILADRVLVGTLRESADADALHPGVAECAPLCRRPAELTARITDAFAGHFAEGRRRWAPHLFEPHHGRDDEVAAELIMDIIERPLDRGRRGSSLMWSCAYAFARRVGR